jgi:hypothetical protein
MAYFLKEKIMAVEKAIGSSSLVEVIDRILDKGIVIDAWARVSLVGIELLAVEARVVPQVRRSRRPHAGCCVSKHHRQPPVLGG